MNFMYGVFQGLFASFIYGNVKSDNDETQKESYTIKLNFFSILQIIWIIELYYFLVNVLLKSKYIKQIINLINDGSESLTKLSIYNNRIMLFYKQWDKAIIIYSVLILISAVIISIMISSFFQYNINLRVFSNYGFDLGMFLLTSWGMYKLFYWNPKWYMFIFMVSIFYYYRDDIKKVIIQR